MTVAALRNDAERMLRFIAADSETPESVDEPHQKSFGHGPQLLDGADSAAHEHGKARAVDHFTFSEMVSEYRALRTVVTRRWLDASGADYNSVIQLVRFNEAINQVLAESVVRFAAGLERESDLRYWADLGACWLYVGVCENSAGTSHIRAAYQTAHATTNSERIQTQTGINERASARRGSNGSSALNASTVKRTLPRRVA